jgi:signal transduction histidine kinase
MNWIGSKSEFVLTASHELRTPLTSVSMAVDLLMESAAPKLTDKERELLAACHEDVQRLRALVNDLLDLSKIEAINWNWPSSQSSGLPGRSGRGGDEDPGGGQRLLSPSTCRPTCPP